MAYQYQIRGELEVENTLEVNTIIDQLAEQLPSLSGGGLHLGIENQDETLQLAVEVDSYMSASAYGRIEGLLQQLGPWCVEPVRFEVRCDDEPGWFYVAKSEAVARILHSRYRLEEIHARLSDLTDYDLRGLYLILETVLKRKGVAI